MFQTTTDLTTKQPLSVLISFTLPILFGNVLQQIYHITDTVIVGYTLGDRALSAIGTTGAIYGLVISLSIGSAMGFSVSIANAFGARNHAELRSCIACTLLFSAITSVVLTLLLSLIIRPLLHFLKTPKSLFADAYSYILIILLGISFTMLYNTLASVLRAVGNSKIPLLFLFLSTFVNAFLVWLFLSVFKTGLCGAASATVISQGIAGILCLIYIIKKCPNLHIRKQDFHFSKNLAKNVLTGGISMALMFSIVNIGSIAMQSAINQLSENVITGHFTARKISEFLMIPIASLAASATTYTSQNLGAKKTSRIKKGIKILLFLGFSWSLAALMFTLCFDRMLIRLITGTSNSTVIATASVYLKINLPFYFLLVVLSILRSYLQGIKQKIWPLIASFTELLGKFAATFFLAPVFGYTGIAITEPVTWFLCCIIVIIGTVKSSICKDPQPPD